MNRFEAGLYGMYVEMDRWFLGCFPWMLRITHFVWCRIYITWSDLMYLYACSYTRLFSNTCVTLAFSTEPFSKPLTIIHWRVYLCTSTNIKGRCLVRLGSKGAPIGSMLSSECKESASVGAVPWHSGTARKILIMRCLFRSCLHTRRLRSSPTVICSLLQNSEKLWYLKPRRILQAVFVRPYTMPVRCDASLDFSPFTRRLQ